MLGGLLGGVGGVVGGVGGIVGGVVGGVTGGGSSQPPASQPPAPEQPPSGGGASAGGPSTTQTTASSTVYSRPRLVTGGNTPSGPLDDPYKVSKPDNWARRAAIANVERERLQSLIANMTNADAAAVVALTQPLVDSGRESFKTVETAYADADEGYADFNAPPAGTETPRSFTI